MSPYRKMERKVVVVSYRRKMENKLTAPTKCRGKFDVRETQIYTDRGDSGKSCKSSAF